MTTKEEKIAQLKLEYPTLRLGDDERGYTDLSEADYEATISDWADAQLEQEAEEEEKAAKAQARTDLLAKLGITAEEAALLLS
jgi:hypothetical protein